MAAAALAAHHCDSDTEYGRSAATRAEKLGEPVFVGLLIITRAGLGEPADDVGHAGETRPDLSAVRGESCSGVRGRPPSSVGSTWLLRPSSAAAVSAAAIAPADAPPTLRKRKLLANSQTASG